jgi:hypothetical protein
MDLLFVEYFALLCRSGLGLSTKGHYPVGEGIHLGRRGDQEMRKNKIPIVFTVLLALFFFSPSPFPPIPSFCSPAFADWAFVVLGDSREDFQRDHVFPQMLQEIKETAYKLKDREVRPEFLLHLGDFELRWGTRESLESWWSPNRG